MPIMGHILTGRPTCVAPGNRNLSEGPVRHSQPFHRTAPPAQEEVARLLQLRGLGRSDALGGRAANMCVGHLGLPPPQALQAPGRKWRGSCHARPQHCHTRSMAAVWDCCMPWEEHGGVHVVAAVTTGGGPLDPVYVSTRPGP